MKCFLLLIFLNVIILLTGCDSQMPEKNEIGHKVMKKIANKMQSTYGLKLIGIGEAGGDAGYKWINMEYEINKILTKSEARKIMLETIKESLKEINNFQELQPYLVEKPFKNIRIVIFFTTPDNDDVFYPDIMAISFSKDKIEYMTKVPEKEFGYHTVESETYEEAEKIVESGK